MHQVRTMSTTIQCVCVPHPAISRPTGTTTVPGNTVTDEAVSSSFLEEELVCRRRTQSELWLSDTAVARLHVFVYAIQGPAVDLGSSHESFGHSSQPEGPRLILSCPLTDSKTDILEARYADAFVVHLGKDGRDCGQDHCKGASSIRCKCIGSGTDGISCRR